MVFKCLVKIKLSLGTSSAATTTPTTTTSLERSLLSLSLLRLRRGGATLFVAAAKTKSVNSNCLLLGLPASQGKQRFGHGPLEAWTRYAPLLSAALPPPPPPPLLLHGKDLMVSRAVCQIFTLALPALAQILIKFRLIFLS